MDGRQTKAWLVFAAGAASGLLVGVGVLVGTLTAPGAHSGLPLPETLLNATATHGSDTFTIATGQIDEYAEALFMLDSLTGDLQCVVMDYRMGKFNAFYKTNVLQDLQVQGRKPKFLLVTGFVNFRTGGTTRPAHTVAYVVDTTTGRYAAYGVPLQIQSKRAAVVGPLSLLDVRAARSEEIVE